MQWSDIPFNPSRNTLRQFAGLSLIFFGGFAVWLGLFRDRPVAGDVLAGLAIVIAVVGTVSPMALRPVFVGWMILAFPIGWAVSRILLGVLYFGIFTPVGVFFRIRGRDPLMLRRRTGQATYWSEKPAPDNVSSYFRQF